MSQHYFEIGIQPGRDKEDYALYFRHSRPDDIADSVVAQPNVYFDFRALTKAESDIEKYGQLLSQTIFEGKKARDAYVTARRLAEDNDNQPLRVRIAIGVGTPRLNTIRWEAMRDPIDDTRMSANQAIHFSRLINDADWRKAGLRSKSKMSALIVISVPTDIDEFVSVTVDPREEVERVSATMAGVKTKIIGVDEPATSEALFEELRAGYDILYLICHGAFFEDRPHLWLQKKDGTSHIMSGSLMAERFRELLTLPRLAVLSSCDSSPSTKDGVEGAPSHLAPRLAEAGIPAVIGMQGPVSVDSSSRFISSFFEALQDSGYVDEAVTAARAAIGEQTDWWIPSLVMRLQSGRIWSLPGFTAYQPGGGAAAEARIWTKLASNIRNQKCTPILGPDLASGFLGSRRVLATRWADTYKFPMARRDRENLPQVAQFLAVEMERDFILDELIRYTYKEAVRQYKKFLEPGRDESDMDDEPRDAVAMALQDLITEQGKRLREDDEAEPHSVLARLNVSIYVTTNYGNMLEEALHAAGRDPVVELCRWNPYTSSLPPLNERFPKYRPSCDQPLVFKIFGELSQPESIVLTEDDYFDFLIGATRNKNLIPPAVRGALCQSALLFLGYELDEWEFRVLFRTIISQSGWGTTGLRHLAATLDPEEGRIIEPERARTYLKEYFTTEKVDIFWGGADEFLRTLHNETMKK